MPYLSLKDKAYGWQHRLVSVQETYPNLGASSVRLVRLHETGEVKDGPRMTAFTFRPNCNGADSTNN